MNETLENDLRSMLRNAGTAEEIEKAISDWDDYFSRLQIPHTRQEQEFSAIMNIRINSGIISLVAPNLEELGLAHSLQCSS